MSKFTRRGRGEQPKRKTKLLVGGVAMDREQVIFMENLRQAFHEQFGRNPTPLDPIPWDPRFSTPTPLDQEWWDKHQEEYLQQNEAAGLKPEMAFAARKLGFILSKETLDLASDEEIDAWMNAQDEFLLMPKDGTHRSGK